MVLVIVVAADWLVAQLVAACTSGSQHRFGNCGLSCEGGS